jgi:hypothetical protein
MNVHATSMSCIDVILFLLLPILTSAKVYGPALSQQRPSFFEM